MDLGSLDTLELPKILHRLTSLAAFSASKELASSLSPTADLEEARRRQTDTSEAKYLLSVKAELSVGDVHDVRPQVLSATRDAVLEPEAILEVKNTLASARSLRRTLEKLEPHCPQLWITAAQIDHCPAVTDSIQRALNDRGEVVDSASDELSAIRRNLRTARDRLTHKLQRLINDHEVAAMLQETLITQRDGRFVVPLRAEFKGRLKAVVHDQSASGATLFVEPLQVVELNNELRELELAERDEVRRILTQISRLIADHAQAIACTVEALATLDLAFAKARLSEKMDGVEPVFKPFTPRGEPPHPGSTLKLIKARHPLLAPSSVVPFDLVLDNETYGLVITGPNTGGKTVALKMAGLLALMSQCGLHVPAMSGSELSVFEDIFADIGDEQSIEQSLSTFSAHIATISHVLATANERSLVLLDELGAGTDPQEGSALARAILDTLIARRVTTLVATHYPELKIHAHQTPGVKNANVEFDLESLRPTYKLSIGLPGRSNALAIAERLGLDRTIVAAARAMVSPDELRADSLLEDIRRQRQAADQALGEADRARASVLASEEELMRRLQSMDVERLGVLDEARRKADEELEEVRQEVRRLRTRLQMAARPLDELRAVETELEHLAAKVPEPKVQTPPELEQARRSLRPGDRVFLRSLRAEGVIRKMSADEVEVDIGRLRVRARMDDLDPAEGEPGTVKRRVTLEHGSTPDTTHSPSLELHLRGMKVDEALEELEKRLDAAYLAGAPFLRIVHGKGTGRLRRAIRDALKGNPYVASFETGTENEGGEGATVVRLAI